MENFNMFLNQFHVVCATKLLHYINLLIFHLNTTSYFVVFLISIVSIAFWFLYQWCAFGRNSINGDATHRLFVHDALNDGPVFRGYDIQVSYLVRMGSCQFPTAKHPSNRKKLYSAMLGNVKTYLYREAMEQKSLGLKLIRLQRDLVRTINAQGNTDFVEVKIDEITDKINCVWFTHARMRDIERAINLAAIFVFIPDKYDVDCRSIATSSAIRDRLREFDGYPNRGICFRLLMLITPFWIERWLNGTGYQFDLNQSN